MIDPYEHVIQCDTDDNTWYVLHIHRDNKMRSRYLLYSYIEAPYSDMERPNVDDITLTKTYMKASMNHYNEEWWTVCKKNAKGAVKATKVEIKYGNGR